MAETFYRDWCPNCKNDNWISNGDTSDMTVPDCGSLVECWNCQHKWNISDFEDGIDFEDAQSEYCEKGRNFVEVPHKT